MTARAEEIRTERRRRNSAGLSGPPRRLAVEEARLDRDKFEYRWANDQGNRLHNLTQADDWEVVPDHQRGTGQANHATPVGTQQDGTPMKAVLLRKLKVYAQEDEAAKQRQVDEREAAIRSKPDPTGGDASNLYVPDGKANPTQISTSRS